jgi:hypothetical protein
MDKKTVLRRIKLVRAVVAEEVSGHSARSDDGGFSSGLASEGFSGGYLQALDDVAGALEHGYPSDHRGYWRKAAKSDVVKSGWVTVRVKDTSDGLTIYEDDAKKLGLKPDQLYKGRYRPDGKYEIFIPTE